VRNRCDVIPAFLAWSVVLPSVAKVSIAAFSNVLLPLWLCVVFTANMFGPTPYWLSEGNTACVPKIRNTLHTLFTFIAHSFCIVE
jgi:hypothetical protein